MAERKTGVFPLDYLTEEDKGIFSDSEVAELMYKTFEYLRSGIEPTFSKRIMSVRFKDYKKFFENNREKFERRTANLKQYQTESAPNRTESEEIEPSRNQIGYENENVYEYEYENTNTSKKKSRPKSSIKELVEGYSNNYHMVEDLYAFIEMRKKMKAPMTEQAVKLALNKLSSLTQDEEEAIKIIEQSIEHGWKSFYPLKEEKPKTRQEELHQLYEKYKKEEEESGQKRHDNPDEFSFSDIFQLESGEF